MPHSYDIIICGLGIMGRSAACELAHRGHRVLALDRHGPDHELGSSHGQSRMIRRAYFEGECYIPMLNRAYDAWREWEEESGQILLDSTGGLFIGPEGGVVAGNSLRAATAQNLPHDHLSSGDMQERFPSFVIPEGHRAVFEPGAGQIRAADAMRSFRYMAAERGADLRFDCGVTAISKDRDGTLLIQAGTDDFRAPHLILSPGSWSAPLLKQLGLSLPLQAERQELHWYSSLKGPPDLPPAVIETEQDGIFYCFPEYDGSWQMKCGFHRKTGEARANDLRKLLDRYLPALGHGYVRSKTCLYTMTPDEHFIIGAVPRHQNIFMASGFSGHGFKFAPVIGEIIADLVAGDTPPFDLTPFSPERFL